MMRPVELSLELVPSSRTHVFDVAERVRSIDPDLLRFHSRALYCSFHTTAGYLEQGLSRRLNDSRAYLDPFIRFVQRLFPHDAGYRHDALEERTELTEAQRRVEPKNADSHLAYIGSGLTNCATYVEAADEPVYLVDLDGVVPAGARRRRTTVIAYGEERALDDFEILLAAPRRAIDTIDLRDRSSGIFEEIAEWVRRHGIERGRLDLALDDETVAAGLTVNEHETLLMRYDVADVLRDPLRFVADRTRSALRDPWAVPGKTLDYARHDLVQVFNEVMDGLGFSESAIERVLAKLLAAPASRLLRFKRSISLLVADGEIVCGTYQSPILVQWRRAPDGSHRLAARLVEFG